MTEPGANDTCSVLLGTSRWLAPRSDDVATLSALALDDRYSYLHPSRLDPAAQELRLATFSADESEAHPHFFPGRLVKPKRTAGLLPAFAEVPAGDRRAKWTHFRAEKGPTWDWCDHAG